MKLVKRIGSAKLERRSMEATADDLAAIATQVPEGWAAPTVADVYVASALVCNDLVDHYSTRFTREALAEIVALLPGTNVMRNHNEYGTDDLPIGRCYAAELVEMPDGVYVRAHFYWERGTAAGDAMAKKVSLGIWREVSLSWWMRSFTNSIDGKPFDESPYYAGQELADGQTVIGIMSDIVELNEFSVVARGGQKNTSINPGERKVDTEDVMQVIAASRARVQAHEHAREGAGWGDFWGRR